MSELNGVFDREEYKEYQSAWNKRNQELRRRKMYATGEIYNKSLGGLGWLRSKLERDIRPLYLPLSKAVSVDAGIIPGGWKLMPDTPDDIQEAAAQVYSWSKWGTDGVLYVHYGAQYGPVGLKVSDLREEGKIVIAAVEPTKYMLVSNSEYDDTPAIAFYVENRTGGDGKHEYAEVTTPETICTFRDGVFYGYDGREPEEENTQGLVNYVEAVHLRDGTALGQCTFQDAIAMLDEANRTASQLGDMIKKHAEPQWFASGVQPSEMFKSADVIWFSTDPNGDIKPLVAPIDIKGVLEFVREIANNVKDALPEKAFEDLRNKDQIATATLEIQLMDLVLKVQRTRPNYDDALERALRMAGMAAEKMGLSDVAALNSEKVQIDPERAILPTMPIDGLKEERAFWEAAKVAVDAGYPLDLYLARKGWDEDAINRYRESSTYEALQAQLAYSVALMGDLEMQDDG